MRRTLLFQVSESNTCLHHQSPRYPYYQLEIDTGLFIMQIKANLWIWTQMDVAVMGTSNWILTQPISNVKLYCSTHSDDVFWKPFAKFSFVCYRWKPSRTPSVVPGRSMLYWSLFWEYGLQFWPHSCCEMFLGTLLMLLPILLAAAPGYCELVVLLFFSNLGFDYFCSNFEFFGYRHEEGSII